jgi:hypothetical protein
MELKAFCARTIHIVKKTNGSFWLLPSLLVSLLHVVSIDIVYAKQRKDSQLPFPWLATA